MYALRNGDDFTQIETGKISGKASDITKQYSTRYNSQGYKLFRYWSGEDYYGIENKVYNHPMLVKFRMRNSETNRLTEWFRATLEIIDIVIFTVIL